MAGKPEQPISHPASQNHIHQQQQNYHQQHSLHLQQQQHQQQHHHHHHQINRRNNQSNQQHNISQQQDTQGIQQNSVLVYVPGDNFAYTTAIEHNNAGGSTGGYQTSSQHQQHQQIPYQGVLPQVATQQTFPAKANYHVVTAQNIVGELDNDIDNGVDCCLGKSIELIDCNILPSNKQQQQQQQNKDDDEYNSSNYRTSGLINGRATGSPSVVNKIDLGALSSSAIQNNNNTSNNNNITSAVRSPGQSDGDSLSGVSDSGIVATATSAARSALPSSAVIIGGGSDNNNRHHHHHQLHQHHHPQHQHLHHRNHQDNNKAFSQTHYNEITSCCGNSGYSISRLSDNYTANDGDTSLNGVNENNLIANNTDENSRLTYVRHNGDLQVSTGIYSIGIDSQLQSQHHELIENKTRIIHQDSLDLNNRGCYINNNNTNNTNNNINNDNSSNINNQVRGIEVGCESVRSDNGESVYSNSSLSSPECHNLQQSVGVDQGVSGNNNNNNNISGVVCAQQAAHLVSQINVQHSNNVALTMNGSVVTQHQQKQHQHQQQQQQQTIAAPCGWKRICTNGVIIYIR
ncbi:hypothetical protein PV327_007879 [Microctonus hyperodae]|uniref:Uncharacterized protein n=1 Tax=Microctonus hyperodae TaxID=165561 RepID=A0AA39G0F8_MICHY|nr:hypothetical protein PV327_007879 [Microctonus hyperodae]